MLIAIFPMKIADLVGIPNFQTHQYFEWPAFGA